MRFYRPTADSTLLARRVASLAAILSKFAPMPSSLLRTRACITLVQDTMDLVSENIYTGLRSVSMWYLQGDITIPTSVQKGCTPLNESPGELQERNCWTTANDLDRSGDWSCPFCWQQVSRPAIPKTSLTLSNRPDNFDLGWQQLSIQDAPYWKRRLSCSLLGCRTSCNDRL